MKTQLYVLLIPFTAMLISAGIFVYLALQYGLVIQWVAAACCGLTALLFLYRIVSLRRQQVSPASDSTKNVDRA